MFDDTLNVDQNLAAVCEELLKEGNSDIDAIAESIRWSVRRGAEQGSTSVTKMSSGQGEVAVNLDQRIADDAATGEADLALCIAAGSATITGPLPAVLRLASAWPVISARYRERLDREVADHPYVPEALSVPGEDRLAQVSGIPEVLEDFAADQMLLVAILVASLEAPSRDAVLGRLHGHATDGTISTARVRRLATSLADLASGNSLHERARQEERPPVFVDPDLVGLNEHGGAA